jgi:hypothetical protein
MPRRPAIVTQADVARAIRAAKQVGAFSVEIRPDGTIVIRMSPQGQLVVHHDVDPAEEIVL